MNRGVAKFATGLSIILWFGFLVLLLTQSTSLILALLVVLVVVFFGNFTITLLLLFEHVRDKVFPPKANKSVSFLIVLVNALNLISALAVWFLYYYAISSSTDF